MDYLIKMIKEVLSSNVEWNWAKWPETNRDPFSSEKRVLKPCVRTCLPRRRDHKYVPDGCRQTEPSMSMCYLSANVEVRVWIDAKFLPKPSAFWSWMKRSNSLRKPNLSHPAVLRVQNEQSTSVHRHFFIHFLRDFSLLLISEVIQDKKRNWD